MDYILGETDEDIKVDSMSEHKRILLTLAEQAHSSIDIFTQDLEAEIYDNKDIEQSIFSLSKRHPKTRIRVLVQDSRKPEQDGHRLIKLAQHLTSSVFINNPSDRYKDERAAFMVVDNIGFIHRTVATNRSFKGKANFKAPRQAIELIDYFNNIWQHSAPDIQIRRLYM